MCIFCKVINKEIPSSIVYEDDKVLVFNDINSQAPVHLLAIPKEHISGIAQIKDSKIVGYLYEVMIKLAEERGLDKTGYRIVVNNGPDAGQAVLHLHFHLLGGRAMHWPPG